MKVDVGVDKRGLERRSTPSSSLGFLRVKHTQLLKNTENVMQGTGSLPWTVLCNADPSPAKPSLRMGTGVT